MKTTPRFVGLDVHAATIAVAGAEPNGEVHSLGTIPNDADAVRRLVRKLGPPETLRACYEAGPCGYTLYWQLTQLGVACVVVAPTLIPVKAGDRIKTDRRDAEKLARCFRSGDLTPVWVPDTAHEALRDLVRAREAGKRDQLRARHRLQKFLLRHGRQAPAGVTPWTTRFHTWLGTVQFAHPAQEATRQDYQTEVDHARDRIARLERAIDAAIAGAPAPMRRVIDALQALRGVAQITAATIVAEVGPLTRFDRPRQLMAYTGVVPREDSSGPRIRRGQITKTGNAHLRRVVTEAAWAYQHRPQLGKTLRQRQRHLSEPIKAIAWKAQHRLHARYRRLAGRGKVKQQIVTAVGRELLGFIWAIGHYLQTEPAVRAA